MRQGVRVDAATPLALVLPIADGAAPTPDAVRIAGASEAPAPSTPLMQSVASDPSTEAGS
ncbi:hypothetical protein BFL35_14365 [Clavibacter michiganensis]|nr:hypothetical protein BFL35_14365 [Clavibacter michiganensis]